MSFPVVLALTLLWMAPPGVFILDPKPWDAGALFEFLERAAHEGAVPREAGETYYLEGATARQQALARVMGLSGRVGEVPAGSPRTVTDFRVQGSVQGDGAVLVLDHRENATFTAISFLLDRRETVRWAADGAVIVDSAYSGGNTARARNFAEQYGVSVVATDAPPAAAFELHRPRVGLLRGTGEMRWVEWVLDQYKVPYSVTAAGARLRTRFDSLVLCGEVADPASLDSFVRDGGTLVAIGAGAAFAARSLTPGATARTGGGTGPARFDPAHPVAFGMPRSVEIFAAAPVFWDTKPPVRRVATANDAGVLLDCPLGRGRVLLFGFEPQFRGEAYQTFRLLLNALYLASAQAL